MFFFFVSFGYGVTVSESVFICSSDVILLSIFFNFNRGALLEYAKVYSISTTIVIGRNQTRFFAKIGSCERHESILSEFVLMFYLRASVLNSTATTLVPAICTTILSDRKSECQSR
jgi:hypothetical protein